MKSIGTVILIIPLYITCAIGLQAIFPFPLPTILLLASVLWPHPNNPWRNFGALVERAEEELKKDLEIK